MSGNPARIALRRYGDRPERHVHGFQQIVAPIAGAMAIEIEGRARKVSPAEVAIVPAGAVHEFETTAESRFLVFDLDAADPGLDAAGDGRAPVRPIAPTARRYVRFLAHEITRGDAVVDTSPAAVSLAVDLFAIPGAPPPAPADAEARLEAIARRLARDPGRRPDIAALAREAGLSRSRFYRLFRETTGQSPGAIRTEARLQRAADRLLASGETVSEIAYDLGYDNASSFTNIFKRRFGLTPSEFRSRGK